MERPGVSTHESGGAATPCAPATWHEIERLPDEGLIARYAVGIENFDRRIVRLTDEQLDTAFLPEARVGRWPARVLVGHLADAELAYVHRMRRAVAEDNPLLAVWDENAFIDAGLYGGPAATVGGFLATIHTLRRWTAEWVSTLSPEQMERRALHPERGPQTVRQILVTAVWHLEHHAAFLNAKIAKMLGPAPSEPERGGAEGGCGPGCGCRPAR